MATLKEYNVKLARLRSSYKMTRTMKMVSANKLRKSQDLKRRVTAYADTLDRVVRSAASDENLKKHPLLGERRKDGRKLVLVITSDRGLCGSFNNNVNKKVLAWLFSATRGPAADVTCCGKKGFSYLKGRTAVNNAYEGVSSKPTWEDAIRIGRDLLAAYREGRYDGVYLAYSMSTGAASSAPVIQRVLPVETAKPRFMAFDTTIHPWLVEPDSSRFVEALIPRYVNMRVYFSLLCSAVGEHGARMLAMENATRNAGSIIDQTLLLRNRARQAKITTELIEIVAGSEAQA